ncbi:MAG: glycosyltransferase family 4 protein [Gaiella sp.]|nr:glycosyltransferase family 4 protein [Gaiella sp.]
MAPLTAPIAYVVSRFPVLTETFIVTEMDALARAGTDLELYSLVVESPGVVSDASRAWQPRLRTCPWMSAGVVGAGWRLGRRRPIWALRSVGRLVAGHVPSPRFLALALALTPKSVAFGEDMRRRGVGHVHAHFGTHAALSAMVAARSAGIPFSFTVHAYDLFVDRTFLAAKVRAAAFVATISEYNRGVLVSLVPEAVDKIHVVRCGVVAGRALASRPDPGSRVGGPRLLAVAALLPYKGLRHLIEAVSTLRPRLPGVSATIIGEGPERGALSALSARLGLEGVVHLPGAVPAEEVRSHLAGADIFVLPSVRAANGDMDGIPVALMEAMVAGVPVVTSRLGGIPELVRDDETGLLTPPGDAGAIADAVERLWATPALRTRLTGTGQRHVRAEFDVDRNAERLIALFQRSLSQRGSG